MFKRKKLIPKIKIGKTELTLGKYPVPKGTTCEWPECDNLANGSIGNDEKRMYFCKEHLIELSKT